MNSKPPKALVLIYFLWVIGHILLSIIAIVTIHNGYTIFGEGNWIDFFFVTFFEFWPLQDDVLIGHSNWYIGHYTIEELTIYTCVPLAIYAIWQQIEKSMYPEDSATSSK